MSRSTGKNRPKAVLSHSARKRTSNGAIDSKRAHDGRSLDSNWRCSIGRIAFVDEMNQ